MALPNSRPSTTAGTKPINTFSAKRWACRSVGRATSVARIFCQYTRMTAKMAPVWMAISNTLALASSKPSSDPARIRWPVDEMGRNSVNPSTTPMMAALTSKTISTRNSFRPHGPAKAQIIVAPHLGLAQSLLPGDAAPAHLARSGLHLAVSRLHFAPSPCSSSQTGGGCAGTAAQSRPSQPCRTDERHDHCPPRNHHAPL